MGFDWRKYALTSGWEQTGDEVKMNFIDGRGHCVRVVELADEWLLRGMVVRAAQVDARVLLTAWRRNRRMRLVGFRVDERGRLVGECRLPKAGLEADEFRLGLFTVARECDRFEHALSGVDVE